MRMKLRGATAVLLLASTALWTIGSASADNYDRGHGDNHAAISVNLGGIAIGYRDGYWDNAHHWHHWRNSHERNNYRSSGTQYHSWNHNRDGDDGWHQQ